ncbi:hypothetical protein ACE6H2_000071 [Prunus campanulata]
MGDTALHIAAFDGETEIVLQLLRHIGNNILKIQNNKGNTPLHLAAVVGDVKTCHAMATKEPKLVSSLNNENETPLFLEALNGHENVFLCLHSHCEEGCYSFRARNGDTILHAAMSGLIAEELKGQEVDKKICPRGKKGRNIDNRGSESQEFTISCGNRMCCSLSLVKRGNKKEDAENPQEKSSSMPGMNQREEDGRESRPNFIYSSCVKFFNLITAVLVAINGQYYQTLW